MMDARVVAIIQARMASSRLPGKVLEEIAGEPMLVWVVDRVGIAKNVDEVVVATTIDPSDDPVVDLCRRRGYACHRGHPTDVLDRYWETAKAFDASIVVRVTADCPLIDPDLIDEAIEALVSSETQVDFVANRLPWGRTYPIGLDVEVCTIDALETAWHEAEKQHQREHVMPFLYESPERFKVVQLDAQDDYGEKRWTVDTQKDLEFIREVAKLLPDRSSFNWLTVLQIVEEHPEIADINVGVKHKTHKDVG